MNSPDNYRRMPGGVCCHYPRPIEVTLHPTDEPLISLKNINVIREDKEILKDVNLTINKGDFIAITGPNGGGKTTLLRLILGLIEPTSGSLNFERNLCKIGYLPQKNMVDSHFPLTVREVVESGLIACKGLSKQERQSRVDDTLNTIELAERANQSIGRLSGGQLQRVLLGRALISRPSLLVLDEPLSYIDKHFESHIYRIIARVAGQSTILLVSHEMTTIASMANRHLLVDRHVEECRAEHHFAASACDDE